MRYKELIKPKRLKPNDTIGVKSPSSPAWSQADILKSCDWWEARGYNVKLAANLNKGYGYVAGTAEERAADVNRMISDESVAAIIPLRGGCSSAQILELIDFDAFNANPKIFAGFSDITSMHLAFAKRTDVVTFHAPTFCRLAGGYSSEYTVDSFFAVIANHHPIGNIFPAKDGAWLYKICGGVAEAPIIGGNLSLLCASIGTPYEFDADECILLIEEIGVEPWVVINYLTHLRNANKLDRVAGVVIAEGENVHPYRFEPTYHCNNSHEDVLYSFFKDMAVPVLYGMPMGHTRDMASIPMRVMARLDADAKSLEILEAGVTE
jgi:muramoyltetrapeptide carboxypeptidase